MFTGIEREQLVRYSFLFTGIEREQLVRYSFLLSIPAILGAATIDAFLAQDTREAAEDLHLIRIESYAIGAAISALLVICLSVFSLGW
jgi:undecaprenyl pyrophosphate phosphatase UppP